MDTWAKFLEALVKLIGKVGGLWTAYFFGKKSEKSKAQKQELKAHEKRNEIEDNIVRLDPDKRKRMRDKWSRD